MSNTPMKDPNELAAYDQADAPERSEDELSEQQLNEVAGGLSSRYRNDEPNDRYVTRNDDTNDPNDALAR